MTVELPAGLHQRVAKTVLRLPTIELGRIFSPGAVVWAMMEAFGRGKRWAYWTVLACGLLVPAGGAAALVFGWPWGDERTVPVAAMVVAGVVTLVLLLPKSRHHFFSSGQVGKGSHAPGGGGAAGTGSTFAT